MKSVLAFYDSHFGPVPVKVTKAIRNGANWCLYATVTVDSPKLTKMQSTSIGYVFPKGKMILGSERSIFPKGSVKMGKSGDMLYMSYDPAQAYSGLIEENV